MEVEDDSGGNEYTSPETEQASQEDGVYATAMNPWLHLKTITTFDSAHHETSEDQITEIKSYQKSQDLNVTYASGDAKLKASNAKSHSEMMSMGCEKLPSVDFKEVFHSKSAISHMSCCNEKQTLSSQSILTRSKNQDNRHSKRLIGQCRSRQSSLSEGYAQSTGLPNVANSASCHQNGSVSDAGGDIMNVRVAPRSPAPVDTVSHFSPTSLLVESLIDQLCKLMEKDSSRQKQLYHVICDRLHRMHLIDDSYTIEEFQFMRSHYQRALYQLLAVAKSSTNAPDERSIILPLPSNSNVDVKLNTEQVLEWSRYYHEYQELEYIAKGGFGHVYKVRNKLDGGEYAIKKIYLRYCYVEGFLHSLKEVKMLARLNHPNIVSYKAAWLEPLDDRARKSRLRRDSRSRSEVDGSMSVYSFNSRLPLPAASQPIHGDSSDIVFQDTSQDTDSRSSKTKSPVQGSAELSSNTALRNESSSQKRKGRFLSESKSSSSYSKKCVAGENHPEDNISESCTDETDSSGSSSEEAVCGAVISRLKSRWSGVSNFTTSYPQNWATLYVQMQFCERTLRQWLDERNSSLPAYPLGANTREGFIALSFFRKIVSGIDYIHSQGIVHHDIKPSNIFVNENLKEVQVGDFGLSCCLLSRVDHTGAVGNYHGGVGTRTYAAPEQLRGKCTPKSDIYSLGIVLLELLQPFHTDMERSKVIEKVRAGHLFSELSTVWPHAARLISDLLVTSPAARPTASELLNRLDVLLKANEESDTSSKLAVKDETIRLLKEAVASRDQEIAELRHRLSRLENQS